MPWWRTFFHLIWSTRGREPLLGPTEQAIVRRSMGMTFEDLDVIPHAIGFMPDHVHVAASLPPSVDAAELVKRLKGASSHAVNHRSGEPRAERFSWQSEYGVVTFAERDLNAVVAYVESQPKHHAEGHLWALLERDEPDPSVDRSPPQPRAAQPGPVHQSDSSDFRHSARDFESRAAGPHRTPEDHAVHERARALAAALESFEWAVEEAAGDVPSELERQIREVCLASGLFAPNMPLELGGAGLGLWQQVILEEELGRLTNCLWAALWRPPNVLAFASAEQVERYVRPYGRGEFRGCYAITEPGAGSDTSHLATTARADGDGYVISGEKWFCTGGDIAAFFLVVASVETPSGPAPTIFFVDRDAPGLEVGRHPKFTHHVLYGHPELTLREVRVGADAILGEVGGGQTLTHAWFREERLMIAARCLGAAARCIELAQDFAAERIAFDRPIADYQGVQFPLADAVAELAAARALTYQVTAEIEGGLAPKLAHARASIVKLVASEMVGRVTDRAVQIFGGRGYMRENPVERLWRDTRLDRIWEGTSEIQRLIIARALAKRGLETLL